MSLRFSLPHELLAAMGIVQNALRPFRIFALFTGRLPHLRTCRFTTLYLPHLVIPLGHKTQHVARFLYLT